MTPESPSPLVSVVVLNYNGRRWLPGCLTALAEQSLASIEVVLVDNASDDGSVAVVREQFPWVRLVELDRNAGFTGGNNAGARTCRGRYLAFLNNDTVVDPSWLEALVRPLESAPDVGLAASRIVYLDRPSVIDSAGDGYTRAGGAFKRRHGWPDDGAAETEEVFGACGAACLIRRDVFERLGGFDDDLYLVYEDVDLSYRAQLAGYRCVYVPDALVRHAGSATLGTVSRTSVYYGQRNLEWVYVKNTPATLLWKTLVGHVVYSLAGGVYLAAAGHARTWLEAKWDALRGLPRVVRKRRAVERCAGDNTARVWRLMERGWLTLKWHEKQFDLGKAPEQP